MMKSFLFDVVLRPDDICNLVADRSWLGDEVRRGGRVVFTGRRNTGKTSLVQSHVIADFRTDHPKGLVVVVDLMGVKDLSDISERVQHAFEQGLSTVRPASTFLKKLAVGLRGVRPTLEIDPLTGQPSFTLGLEGRRAGAVDFPLILKQIASYHSTHRALIVFDEFQDIALVKQAEAKMRQALQALSGTLPVIALGSKKHLLSQIFARPAAPLAGWGKYREIAALSALDYSQYANERFVHYGIEISIEATQFLQDQVQNVPESMNIVCDQILRLRDGTKGPLANDEILLALRALVRQRRSLFEEYLNHFSAKERRFLRVLASLEPVKQPHSREFLSRAELSPGGNRPILRRLLDESIVYQLADGYVLGDPLLGHYLRDQYRI